MGLRDRLRETAAQAQEGLAKGQAKLEQFQNRQSSHEHLEALGQAYWLQQSGRATHEQLQALMEEVAPAIQEAEARLGPLPWPTAPASPDTGPPPATAQGPVSTPAPSSVPTSAPSSVPTSAPSSVPASAPSSGPAPVPPPAPSSMPTAIHHDSTPPES